MKKIIVLITLLLFALPAQAAGSEEFIEACINKSSGSYDVDRDGDVDGYDWSLMSTNHKVSYIGKSIKIYSNLSKISLSTINQNLMFETLKDTVKLMELFYAMYPDKRKLDLWVVFNSAFVETAKNL